MKQFKAEHAAVDVLSGQVKLSAEQARARLHNLKAVDTKKDGSGVYQVTNPIQFKRGETFGFDGDVGKNGVLSDPDAEQLAAMGEDDARVEAAVKKVRAECEAQLKAELQKAADALQAERDAGAAALKEQSEKLGAESIALIEAAGDEARKALMDALTPETAALVRAELDAGTQSAG